MRIYAPFLRRAAGFLIDTLIVGVVFVCVGSVMVANAPAWLAALVWIGPWIYVVSLIAGGATLGQRAVQVRTIDQNGAVPGYFKALKRTALPAALTLVPPWIIERILVSDDENLTKTLGYISFVLLIAVTLLVLDFAWALWDARNQTLHDKIGGTLVVSSRGDLQ